MSAPKTLPAEEAETVVEVSLRHVLAAFGSLTVAILTVGAGITLLRDFTRYRRQRAIIEAVAELVRTLQPPERRSM